jgi:hypothetical protein
VPTGRRFTLKNQYSSVPLLFRVMPFEPYPTQYPTPQEPPAMPRLSTH